MHRAAFRKVFNQGPATWAVWSWLLFHAGWAAGDGPGEVLAPVSDISKDCKLSRQQTRSVLEKLRKDGRIKWESKGRKTLFTIVNWKRYQGGRKGKKASPRVKEWRGDED